jgi:xanthine dehydrogenase accessory factor
VRWIDSRDEVFPDELPAYVVCEHSEPVQLAVHDLEAASSVLIMSFSHAEDLEILAACLLRQREKNDLAYIGLIGSATKWARFKHRLQDRGFVQADFDRVTCPIGLPGISSKLPEVIAVSVAAQLLQLSV